MSTPSTTPGEQLAPVSLPDDLRAGQPVDLAVNGHVMSGMLLSASGDVVDIHIPPTDLIPELRTSGAEGVLEISVGIEAAQAPVKCTLIGSIVRTQLIGPVEYVQRRRYARRSLDLPVQLSWVKQPSGMWARVSVRLHDLSVGGLRVQAATTVWPEPGVMVNVDIGLPDGPVKITATVVAKTPDYGLRVRFIGVPADVHGRIKRYTETPSAP